MRADQLAQLGVIVVIAGQHTGARGAFEDLHQLGLAADVAGLDDQQAGALGGLGVDRGLDRVGDGIASLGDAHHPACRPAWRWR